MGLDINKVYNMDCIEGMKKIESNSVDSIVTDPPYGLTFMGKEWDTFTPKEYQDFSYKWSKEALRILKPGGHLLAFSGTRTYHRMVCGIEDTKFEIRDTIAWMYGSGFPKSHNIGKAVDKLQWNDREVVGELKLTGTARRLKGGNYGDFSGPNTADIFSLTKGNTKWEGWGTALKPSFEPIVVARKKFKGSVAENVLKHGTGGLNIDGCRISLHGEKNPTGSAKRVYKNNDYTNNKIYGDNKQTPDLGRFPANIILDSVSAEMLDEQMSENMHKAGNIQNSNISDYNSSSYKMGVGKRNPNYYGDEGGASRFFYCAKAHHSERNAGLDDLETVSRGRWNKAGEWTDETTDVKNNIATLKPINLMRYLVRLVTPPKGIVVDPFAGSGTTGIACIIEGFNYILFEKRERFAKEIIPRRINYWSKSKNWKELNEHRELPKPSKATLDRWL